ncbi:MAG: archease [Candidatus Micrarchaeota archaeon]|nr:archease [Candidatus Micrarchaeota archaeon]
MATIRNSKKYRFVEHTADVEYIAYGVSVESCFRNALLGMFDTISYTDKASASRSKEESFVVKDSASSIEDLLWYSLQDALSVADSSGIFAYRVSKLRIGRDGGSFSISMTIHGKRKSSAASKLDVKGVSRYNLGIKRAKGGISATVVLDV